MADLTDFLPKNFKVSDYVPVEEYNSNLPAKEAFHEIMLSYGFKCPPHIITGQLVRIPDRQDKRGEKTGWYFYSEFQDDSGSAPIGSASFGTWHGDPEKVKWCSKKQQYFTEAERQRYAHHAEMQRIAHETETRVRNQEAKEKAQRMWDAAKSDRDWETIVVS